jgi:hypothetical protein
VVVEPEVIPVRAVLVETVSVPAQQEPVAQVVVAAEPLNSAPVPPAAVVEVSAFLVKDQMVVVAVAPDP